MKEFLENVWTQYSALILSLIPAITALIKLATLKKQAKVYEQNTLKLKNKVNDDIERGDKLKNALNAVLSNEVEEWEQFMHLTTNKRHKAFIALKIERLKKNAEEINNLFVEKVTDNPVVVKKVKVKRKKK